MSREIIQSSRNVIGISDCDHFAASVSEAAGIVAARSCIFSDLSSAFATLENDPQCCIVFDYAAMGATDPYDGLSFVSLESLALIAVVPPCDFDAQFQAACMNAVYALTLPLQVEELTMKLASVFAGNVRLSPLDSAKHRFFAGRYLSLSNRQTQILPLLMQGETNKAIARRLGLELRTVEEDRATMIRHFGANSISELFLAIETALEELH